MRARFLAGGVAALMLIGCTAFASAAAPVDVACTINENTLTCPLPALPAPVTETVTVTETPAPVTVTAPAVTVTATVTAPPVATAPPATTTAPPVPAAFPDATNTGVPAGTTLTPYAGPLTITVAGTVIDSKKITGCLTIRANNVVIRKSLIQAGCFFSVLSINGNTGLQIVDVEIDGLNDPNSDSAVNGNEFTCLRCNIHGTSDGFKAGTNVVIQDTYIHDLPITASSHNDGIQSLGTNSLKILHNRIVVAEGATSAIILSTGNASAMKNILIDNNLLGGGAYTVYGGYQAGVDTLSKISNIAITNNKFTTVVFPRSGAFGPMTSVSPPVVVTGNTWADGPNSGKAVN